MAQHIPAKLGGTTGQGLAHLTLPFHPSQALAPLTAAGSKGPHLCLLRCRSSPFPRDRGQEQV